jgi:biopolymer transport protein ExbB
MIKPLSILVLAAMPCAILTAQTTAPAPVSEGGVLKDVAAEFQQRLDTVTNLLKDARARIEVEKVPMTQKLNALEEKIIEARKEYDRVLRLRDGRTLDVTNLKASIRAKEEQTGYLATLLDEYVRNAETRLHITELQRLGKELESKKNAAGNANLDAAQKLQARLELVNMSMDRIEEAVGGVIFDGSAVHSTSGEVASGRFLLLGPVAYFATSDGTKVGLADLRLGSMEPALLEMPPDAGAATIAATVQKGEGTVPVDSTRGAAFKVEEVKDTWWEEFLKGGPVMWPIGGLGVLAVLVGLLKWLQLSLVLRPGARKTARFLSLLDEGSTQEAERLARGVWGPLGKMMRTAAKHYRDPASVMEESMFERVLDAKTRLNSWIPFVKIAAAVEPLLGLLGTVTGMINTFKLITVFGTGDAQTFSSGISEALITTEWGLITAIPCLLIAAFLARKAKAALDDMEKLGVRIMNHRRAMEQGGGPPPSADSADGKQTAPTPGVSAVPQDGGTEGLVPSPAV